jgi:hypothetical protein
MGIAESNHQHRNRRVCIVWAWCIWIALSGTACVHREVAIGMEPTAATPTPTETELQALVGRSTTLCGPFSQDGKLGSFLLYKEKTVIYFISHRSRVVPYAEMEGHNVCATGMLHFVSYPRPPITDKRVRGPFAAVPPDHFYFDEDEATVVRSDGR